MSYGPAFPGEHECMECYRYVHEHEPRCFEPDGEAHEHHPPLCCLGCPCESYEEAHPGARARHEAELAAERQDAIDGLLDLDRVFAAPGPPLPGRGRTP